MASPPAVWTRHDYDRMAKGTLVFTGEQFRRLPSGFIHRACESKHWSNALFDSAVPLVPAQLYGVHVHLMPADSRVLSHITGTRLFGNYQIVTDVALLPSGG